METRIERLETGNASGGNSSIAAAPPKKPKKKLLSDEEVYRVYMMLNEFTTHWFLSTFVNRERDNHFVMTLLKNFETSDNIVFFLLLFIE